MAYLTDGYHSDASMAAAHAVPNERVKFLQRTYGHLAGAVLAFIAIEAVLLQTGVGVAVRDTIFSGGKLGMFALMAAFIAAGYVARTMARSTASIGMQYAGLALYVGVEALIFLPILSIAMLPRFADEQLIAKAGLLTFGLFLGLSTAVFLTKADFSWMGTALCVLGWVALGTVLAGWIFGFSLGLWFSAIMIALAAGYIAYDTSMILHHYPTTMYVAASLELFASVALLFYYILRFAMQMTGSNRD